MSTTRRFSVFDLLRFNNVNLDPLTETYNMSFYTQYLAKWPEYCFNVTAPQGRPMGYILGKAEDFHSEPNSWHGHVTAVTVPPLPEPAILPVHVGAADAPPPLMPKPSEELPSLRPLDLSGA